MKIIDLIFLAAGLAMILTGAEFFTNGVEWLGKKLKLGEGAIGSILAAVGTALPETSIPIIAFLTGRSSETEHIGIGAILGAPFMLATLAFFVTGLAAKFYLKDSQRPELRLNHHLFRWDLQFFLAAYLLAGSAAVLPFGGSKKFIAVILVLIYAYYLYRTFTGGEKGNEHLKPLYMAVAEGEPRLGIVGGQILISLVAIIGGAKVFVQEVEELARFAGLPPLLLSLIVTPIATELPEKFNSVIWIREGKDTLAVANITGAMVFQGSLIPAIGMVLTPWEISPAGLASVFLAFCSTVVFYLISRTRGRITPAHLMLGGLFYLFYPLLLFADRFSP